MYYNHNTYEVLEACILWSEYKFRIKMKRRTRITQITINKEKRSRRGILKFRELLHYNIMFLFRDNKEKYEEPFVKQRKQSLTQNFQ